MSTLSDARDVWKHAPHFLFIVLNAHLTHVDTCELATPTMGGSHHPTGHPCPPSSPSCPHLPSGTQFLSFADCLARAWCLNVTMGAGTSREESWTWPSVAGEHAGVGWALLGQG